MKAGAVEAVLGEALATELGQRPPRNGDIVSVPSYSHLGVAYDVLVGIDGECQCSCADYERRHHDCKHIRYVKENLLTTTAITTIKVQPPATVLPTPEEWQSMDMAVARLAETQSIALPSNLKNKQDIRAVILAGWEIGVKPMTALRHISVINGKTEPDGQLMAGILLAKEPDASFEIMVDDAETTTVRLRRPTKNLDKEYTYTNQDARTAGLWGKGAWANYPRDMRRWAAVKRLCRAYCPDVINGIASVTMGDLPTPIDPQPEEDPFIDVTATQVNAPPDEANLYSEGDDPAAPVEDDAGVTTVATTTEQQRVAIANWIANWTASVDSQEKGRETLLQVLEEAKVKWPYAIEAGRFSSLRLTTQDAESFIAMLKVAAGEPETEPVQASLA